MRESQFSSCNISLAEIVVKAVYDLEITARSLHPALSWAAAAEFFRSWQVWRQSSITKRVTQRQGLDWLMALTGFIGKLPRHSFLSVSSCLLTLINHEAQ